MKGAFSQHRSFVAAASRIIESKAVRKYAFVQRLLCGPKHLQEDHHAVESVARGGICCNAASEQSG